MKKLLMIIAAATLMIACGSANSEDCKKDCKKECCTKDEKSCKKDCKKECCAGKEDGEKTCKKDCKKTCCSKGESELTSLTIGTENPSLDVAMKDISGADLTLAGIAKENGLLVIFSCNTCPFVVGREGKAEGWENRYNDIKAWSDKTNVGFVLVNSNEGKREKDDSFEAMQQHAIDAGYDGINYVVDNNHIVADAFGAKTTPHVYLFNKENKLVYVGAIDDNVNAKADIKEQYLANALTNLAEGKDIDPSETKNLGCSIKRIKADHGEGHGHKHDGEGHGHSH